MRAAALLALMTACCAAESAFAQQPVYLCNGVYTDKPCKDGREVDINPTRGAHSYSGTRRESTEAVLERINRDMDRAGAEGVKQANEIIRCEELRRQRSAIDASGQADALKELRFSIREEQHRLRCKRT
jgi:hypothetical protein